MTRLRKNFAFNDIILVNFVNMTGNESETVRKLRNSASVKKWMFSSAAISRKMHALFIEHLKTDNENYYWLVKKAGSYIGIIYLQNIDLKHKHAYLGIYSNPAIKKAGTVLMEGLCKIAFKVAHLRTLKLMVFSGNERAIAFYKRTGFVQEGLLREFIFKNRKWHDIVIMGKINKEV